MEDLKTPRVAICLTEIEIKDLNDTVYKIDDISKQLGNIIFTSAESIEVSDHARTLHKGKTARLTEKELNEVLHIIAGKPYYKPFAHLQILNYLNNKLKTFNK